MRIAPSCSARSPAKAATASITVTVTDEDNLSSSTTFEITVTSGNVPPTISLVENQTIPINSSAGPINFTVDDEETPAANLLISGSSSNQNLVMDANILFGGNSADRTLLVTPTSGASGSAIITLVVSDADGQTATTTFELTVLANTPPTITAIDDQNVNFNSASQLLRFSIDGL